MTEFCKTDQPHLCIYWDGVNGNEVLVLPLEELSQVFKVNGGDRDFVVEVGKVVLSLPLSFEGRHLLLDNVLTVRKSKRLIAG